jgi:predicted secreted hydrolase
MHTVFKTFSRALGAAALCCLMAQAAFAEDESGTSRSQVSTPPKVAASVAHDQSALPVTFARVVPARPLAFPQDRGAHPDFRTEWWYATGWLQQPDGKPLGFQITFFRSATEHDRADPSAFAPTQLIIAHAALSNPDFGHLVHDQRIARQGFDLAYARSGDTNVKLDKWRMTRDANGNYQVNVTTATLSLHLSLMPTQPVMQQGENGYSQKGPNQTEASYYYSEPQLRVSGFVSAVPDARAHPASNTGNAATDNGKVAAQTAASDASKPSPLLNVPVTGSAWLDHEWSSTVLNPKAVGWDWLGANMDDGSALMAFEIRGKEGQAIWAHAAWRDVDGTVENFGPDAVAFTPQRKWRSPRTDITYPVAQQLGTGALQWQLIPLFDDQELDSSQSTGAVYWEGAVRISRNGQHVGQGYLELTGYGKPMSLE